MMSECVLMIYELVFLIIPLVSIYDLLKPGKSKIIRKLFRGNNRRILLAVQSLLLLTVAEGVMIPAIVLLTIFSLSVHLYLFEVYNSIFKEKLPYLVSNHRHKYVSYIKNIESTKKNIGKNFCVYELFLVLSLYLNLHNYIVWVCFLIVSAVSLLLSAFDLSYRAHRVKKHIVNGSYMEGLKQDVFNLNPQVVLHFGGGADVRFQVDMWLPALKKLNKHVLIVVRRSGAVNLFKGKGFPILFVQTEHDIENLLPDSVRVGLFTGNTANNLVLIRLPRLVSVFIGHGDSDKAASSNNVSRIYNSIFVAGQLGVDRYRKAGVRINDENFEIVGRPQLDKILPKKTTVLNEFVILYAPTWEGWSEDQNYCSLIMFGEVMRLLCENYGKRIKIIFRPHPFTGRCSDKYSKEIENIELFLSSLDSVHASYIGSGVDIYSLFNKSDMIITDVSSVLSDYYASEKPVIVSNPNKFDLNRFNETFPSAIGGYNWCESGDLISIIDDVVSVDSMNSDRLGVIDKTLSYRGGKSTQRFNEVISRLYNTSINEKPILLSDEQASVKKLTINKNNKLMNSEILNNGGHSVDRVFWVSAPFGWVNKTLFKAGMRFLVTGIKKDGVQGVCCGDVLDLYSAKYNYRKKCYQLRLNLPANTSIPECSMTLKILR